MEYKNRYGDVFTFEWLDNGNVLMKGNFEYNRIGFANNYEASYKAYTAEQDHPMSMEQFIDLEHAYDEVKEEYLIDRKYRELITSDMDKVTMVDPSGGPFMSAGMSLRGLIENGGKVEIVQFINREDGYEIVVQENEMLIPLK